VLTVRHLPLLTERDGVTGQPVLTPLECVSELDGARLTELAIQVGITQVCKSDIRSNIYELHLRLLNGCFRFEDRRRRKRNGWYGLHFIFPFCHFSFPFPFRQIPP
jgi:hypothetical protein